MIRTQVIIHNLIDKFKSGHIANQIQSNESDTMSALGHSFSFIYTNQSYPKLITFLLHLVAKCYFIKDKTFHSHEN